MHGSTQRSEVQVGERVVVLLLPEALGSFTDMKRLRDTLTSLPNVRVLLCLPDAAGHQFAHMLQEIGVETEILLGADVAKPDVTAFALRAPLEADGDDLIELALALSDAVLVPSMGDQNRLSRSAEILGKQKVIPGDRLKGQSLPSVTGFLDCDAGPHALGRHFFGRIEQVLLELFAFNWRGPDHGGVAESRKRLRRCCGLTWGPGAYFAPPGWEKLALDNAARDSSSEIVSRFEAMDRRALYGSYLHRDITWAVHFLAAFAILSAVVGHLKHGAFTWGVIEITCLVLVAVLIPLSRRFRLQDRWTACRLGAEQLRIARMSLPLLVLPPALATSDAPEDGKEAEPGFLALSEVKRIVRDHGLPRLRSDPKLTPADAARWIQLIVSDQVKYHHDNHHKLECVEHRVNTITEVMFWTIMAAVLVLFILHLSPNVDRFVVYANWLFVIVAAGPAFAAALHGAATRLGIVHRVALSRDVERELRNIDSELVKLANAPPPDEQAWPQVRELAYQAAETMGRENLSWHGLVRRYRDVMP